MMSESRRRKNSSHGGRRQATATTRKTITTPRVHNKLLDTTATADAWVNANISILREGQRQHGKLTSERKGDAKAGKKLTSVTTMSDLLKVLSRIRILEEQHNSTLSTASALRVQLDIANACVRELELAQEGAREEIEGLMKKLAKVKSSWKMERNKFKSAVQALKEELEDEQKARSRIEIANGKMAKELMDANMAATNMAEELARERKARELMEDVCDKLAREIAEDKAEVEDLKQDSIKMHEELEEERRMLQLAEVWREERVQMKLREAKLSLEEKGAALDVLCSELETFLRAGRCRNRADFVQEAEVLHNVVTAIHPRGIIVSYPPAEIKEAAFPENYLYTLDLSYEKQANPQYGHSQENILYPPNWDNRWTDDSGLREGATEAHHQPYMSLINPADEIRRTFGQLQAEEGNNDVRGYEQVSRSQALGYEEDYNMEGVVADAESSSEVNNDDPLYQQKEDSDRVVRGASEEDDKDSERFYEEVDMGGMRNGDTGCVLNGTEGIRITSLHEENRGQVDALDEVILHRQTQRIVWESIPQQSSWISRSNPHIERGMKGHVLWPKGLMDVVTNEKQYRSELEQ